MTRGSGQPPSRGGGAPALEAAQSFLVDALRRPTPLVDDPLMVAGAGWLASDNDRLTPVEQVEIYREQFWLRHVDALRDDFASIEYALGVEAFDRLVRDYIAAFPPASFTLRDLGAAMIAFLGAHAPWSKDAFLVDLARVEWAFVEAFDGPDAPPFDARSIAGVAEDAWPGARIAFHPALQRLRLDHPAHDYRIAVRRDEHTSRPEPRACHVVVYRGPELLHCLEIGADAAELLDALAEDTALGDACERAAAASGEELADFQGKLAAWFSEWTSLGWIRAVTFPG